MTSLRLASLALAAGLFAMPALAQVPLPPAAIPGGPLLLAQAGSDAAAQQVRIGQLEEQMRNLNGRIEELTWQIQQLQGLLQRQQEDTEFRLRGLEGGNAPQKRSDAAPAPTLSPGFSIDTPMDGSGAEAPPRLGEPPRLLGSLPGELAPAAPGSESALGGPLDLSAIARGEPAPAPLAGTGAVVAPSPGATSGAVATAPAGMEVASIAEPQDPRSAYDQAYGYVVAGDYELAEASFKQFLADHPGDELAGNAHFWLGESYFARDRFRDAADSFLATYRDYPKSAKAPESLLKLGLSLEGLGETTAACATYRELEKKFPEAQPALISRANEQKSKAGC